MELNEEERFENEWRQAFDGAEQTPDDAVWGKIERQLPTDRRVRPLWAWWAAAAVFVLTLLAGGLGWWAGRESGSATNPAVVSTSPGVAQPGADNPAGSPPISERPSEGLAAKSTGRTGISEPKKAPATTPEPTNRLVVPSRIESPEQLALFPKTPENLAAQSVVLPSIRTKSSQKPVGKNHLRPGFEEAQRSAIAAVPEETLPTPVTAFPAALTPTNADKSASTALLVDLLNSKTTRPLRVSLRIRPHQMPAATSAVRLPPPVVTPRLPRFWASVGVSPVSYNSQSSLSGSVATAVASNTNYLNTGSRNSYGARTMNQAALSYRVVGRMGMRLSRRWTLESGLEYLAGHSSIQNGLVLLNRTTSAATSLYEKALNQSSYNAADLNTQNVFVPRESQLRSTFRYVSVPVQAGYRLWPDKRVEGLLFAGLAGDFFLGNTLKSVNDPSLATVRYTAANGVYNALVWMGTGGASLRYRLSPSWGASLNGTYRHALSPGVRSGLGVQTSPREVGVGLRLDYRF